MTARALVIGYGSIGQRHAQVLEDIGFTVAVVSRRGEAGGRCVFGDISSALSGGQFECAVVSDETARHADSLAALACAGFRGAVLVEKPLFAWPEPLPAHEFVRSGVGYNLRFHPAVQALRGALNNRHAQMAHFYVGQWLADWRPGRSSTSSYSMLRSAGGGVLRDLSHELDLVTWFFGSWRQVTALGGRLGSITADADDGWSILLTCERCAAVMVHLSYLDRVPRRTVTVQVDGETLYMDLIAHTFQVGENAEGFAVERNSIYMSMHRALLAGSADVCSLEEGLRTVELIAGIEEAAKARRWIDRAA